jgi:hypothetical protein
MGLSRPVESVWLEALEGRVLMAQGDVVVHWNELALQSAAVAQPPRVPIVRNWAIVQAAIFDAVNAIDRSYEPYAADVHASRGASQEAAAAQAGHDTLSALYPGRQAIFDAALADDLAGIPPGRARQGVAIGSEVARQILALRANDGADAIVNYTPPSNAPGQWQPTPPDFTPATNAHYPLMKTFAIESSSQFRPGPPPALTSPEYAHDLNETKAIGSVNSTVRTPDQTQVALVWRVPLTGVTVWNRIAQDLAKSRDTSLPQTARMFALLDIAANDGLQTSFGSKFYYGLWRPVTAIRRADEDGNPATEADKTWTPLHPTTPPYPTYAGNAATLSAANATVLADVFGTNDVPFDVHWDAYGFPGVTRSYNSFSDAADEQARSRIYGGIHFTFDSTAGQQIGRNVGGYVLSHVLMPRGTHAAFSAAPQGAAGGNQAATTGATQDLLTGRAAGASVLGTAAPILA